MDLVTLIVVGLIAGWLASLIMKGRGLGLFGDIVVGVLGAIVGGLVYFALGLGAYGFLGLILMAVVGSIILLALISLFSRDRVFHV